jgi:hypothetical protein
VAARQFALTLYSELLGIKIDLQNPVAVRPQTART